MVFAAIRILGRIYNKEKAGAMFVGVLKENKWNKIGRAVVPKALKDWTFLFNRYPHM